MLVHGLRLTSHSLNEDVMSYVSLVALSTSYSKKFDCKIINGKLPWHINVHIGGI